MKKLSFGIQCFLLLALFITSCRKPEKTIENDAVLSSLYSTSADTLKLRGHNYILETYLYRDFFPGIGIGKNISLFADIFLVSIDSSAIPSNLDIQKLYIIKDQLIWASSPADAPDPYLPDFKLGKLSKNGPEWDTDINVDVITMIADSITSEEYYVIARKQVIHRVE
jgi:hypothetical protein